MNNIKKLIGQRENKERKREREERGGGGLVREINIQRYLTDKSL